MKKNILIILIGSSIFILSILGFLGLKKQDLLIFDVNKAQNINQKIIENKKTNNIQIEEKYTSEKNIEVLFEVLDIKYNIKIKEGSSVFDLMNKIKEENNSFYFKYKEYPSLGIFIEEINGLNSVDGKYWIYYINNKEASVGVSRYVLKEGDSILWKQE